MGFCLVYIEGNCCFTVKQACVHVLNLRDSGMLFALCPFYFCHTKTGMKTMHRLSHIHSEVSIADTTKRKKGGIRRRQQVMKRNKNTVCSRASECIQSSLHMPDPNRRLSGKKADKTHLLTRAHCGGAKEQVRCREKRA